MNPREAFQTMLWYLTSSCSLSQGVDESARKPSMQRDWNCLQALRYTILRDSLLQMVHTWLPHCMSRNHTSCILSGRSFFFQLRASAAPCILPHPTTQQVRHQGAGICTRLHCARRVQCQLLALLSDSKLPAILGWSSAHSQQDKCGVCH